MMNIIETIENNKITLVKAALILIFALTLLSSITNSFLKNAWLKNLEFEISPFDETKEIAYVDLYEALPTMHEDRDQLVERYPMERNFFAPVVKRKEPKNPFVIQEIVFEPLSFMYMGHIERGPSDFIGQINWGDRTYFVKAGDMMQEWTVKEVAKERVIIVNKDGSETELPLYKQIFSEKPYAVVRKYGTQKVSKINIGDTLEQYTVVDITKNSVVLSSDSRTITLNK